jgi:hypothetical protein
MLTRSFVSDMGTLSHALELFAVDIWETMPGQQAEQCIHELTPRGL